MDISLGQFLIIAVCFGLYFVGRKLRGYLKEREERRAFKSKIFSTEVPVIRIRK